MEGLQGVLHRCFLYFTYHVLKLVNRFEWERRHLQCLNWLRHVTGEVLREMILRSQLRHSLLRN